MLPCWQPAYSPFMDQPIFFPSNVMLPQLKYLQLAKIEYDGEGGIPKIMPALSLLCNRISICKSATQEYPGIAAGVLL